MRTAALLPLLGALVAPAAAQETAVRDTTITLEPSGEVTRENVAGRVVVLRLENDRARVEAGATYRALRLRLSWQGASGTVRLRTVVPAELQALFPPTIPNSPR
jgi:hypothetical protein